MKTIEEAATDFSKDIRENSLTGNNAGKQQYQVGRKIGFNAGVEFAQRWIPVEEELPETNEFEESRICLIKNRYAIDIGRYYSNKKRWFLSSSNFEVTHWRYVELT
jgi:hypothetical protein